MDRANGETSKKERRWLEAWLWTKQEREKNTHKKVGTALSPQNKGEGMEG